jgi:hypothetical protein
VGFLAERFTDHSQRLEAALQRATANAWRPLELALAGESFRERLRQGLLARKEDRVFAGRIQIASGPAGRKKKSAPAAGP